MGRKKRKKLKQFGFKANPKHIWIGGFSLVAVILFSCLGYAIYTSSVFKINEKDIKSDLPLGRGLKEKINGQSLFSLDIEEISSRLIKEYPEYKGIYVFKQFPSSLVVQAQKRKPFAQMKGKRFYPIDKEAVIISSGSRTPQPGLISIEVSDYNKFFKKGKIVDDKRLEYAFGLIESLGRQDFLDPAMVELINATKLDALYFMISDSGFHSGEGSLERDIKVIIGKDEFDKKINHLKEVIGQEIGDKISSVEYIDLRYKKIYVGFRR